MKGIETITQRIAQEAQGEAEGILDKARQEAAAIQERYQAQADKEAAELKGKNEKAAAQRQERLISAAQMEARKTMLGVKQELVEEAYDKALEKLCTLPRERYEAVLADLLVQAAPRGQGEVIFSPEDQNAVGAAVVDKANAATGGKLTLSRQTRPMRGGFILKDGSVEVNCDFDTLVRLQKGQTAGEVAQKLFG